MEKQYKHHPKYRKKSGFLKALKGLVLLLFIGINTAVGYGQTPTQDAFFDAATKAYNAGDYSLALDYYEKILAQGYHSGELYFNMGNAYYKQNQIAQSIYFFEKALMLNPKDSEILKNLGFAKKMTIDAIPTKVPNGLGEAFKSMIAVYPIKTWSNLTIVFMLLAIALYFIYYFGQKPLLKRMAFSFAVIFLIASLFVFNSGVLLEKESLKNNPAIVFETAKVLSEPNPAGVQSFELHEGTKVQVLENYEDWFKIQISDGQTGWLKQNLVKLLKD